MKKYYLLFAYTLVVMGFAACSKDDEQIEPPVDYVERMTVSQFDQLEFFQNNLVEIDSDGNFVQRIYGVPLDPADETVVSIGVESISEAKEIFKGWLSPDAKITENGDVITFFPVDEEGKAQGKITFSASSGSDVKLAEVSFSSETKIKQVSKVVFIKSSVWPNNAGSAFFVGDKVGLETYDEGVQSWICIREWREGTPGLLMYISAKQVCYGTDYIKQFASVSAAKEASKVLNTNWPAYEGYFKDVSRALNKEDYYWINDWKYYVVGGGIYAIQLETGYIDWFEIVWKTPRKNYLQIKTFGELN